MADIGVAAPHGKNKITGIEDEPISRHHHSLFHHVFKLPDITRPGVPTEVFVGFVPELFCRNTLESTDFVDKMTCQQGNISATLAKWRHLNWYDIQAIIQILAELALLYALEQVQV